ncbi:MAG: MBL fold metallo-hydrolase [Firmicutes bacterium]|nr:MBL fold metallo-hydrolase [Bacillota bacterium]
MTKQLTDNVRCLGNRHFNFFIVGQKEAALIECGVTGAVVNFYQQWQSAVLQPEIRYLIAMHAHFDHVCGIPALRKMFPTAAVAASPHAQKVMGKPTVMENFFAQDEQMVQVLMKEGFLPEPVRVPPAQTIIVDYLLEDGDTLYLRTGIKLEIIAAPGHSPCSLAAYLPADKVMFLSDAAGFQISDTEIFPIFFQGYELYVETIKRLMGYPTNVLGIAHERIWTGNDIEIFYKRALEAAQNAFKEIREMTEAGLQEAEMKDRLFNRYYQGNLRIYTPENIHTCIDLLIKRVQECL